MDSIVERAEALSTMWFDGEDWENEADAKAYNEALDGAGGSRYPMEEVVRMAVEAE